jgi:hypothetical protein
MRSDKWGREKDEKKITRHACFDARIHRERPARGVRNMLCWTRVACRFYPRGKKCLLLATQGQNANVIITGINEQARSLLKDIFPLVLLTP